jgi:predicted GIY-YIG superfamily endonuclease
MAEKVNIEVDVDYKGAVDNLEKIKDEVVDLGKTTKEQKSATSSLASGFKGVGFAMKAAGFGIIMKIVDAVTDALMQNQAVVDTVSTAFNVVGVVLNKIITTFESIFSRTTESSDNFDALGRIMRNLMTLALLPFKASFMGIGLVISQVQLAWEKSWLGKGDVVRIQKLTKQVDAYKESLKQVAIDGFEAANNIVKDFREGVDEVMNIAVIVQEEFTNTLDDMTVNSVLNQARGITRAKNNIALLGAEQQKLILLAQDEAEAQRIIRDDISKTFEERIEANKELLVLSEKARKLEEEGTRKQIASLNAQLSIDSKNVDLLAQKKELENNLIEIGLREKALKKEQKEQENALLQEQNAILQELSRIGVEEQDRRKLEFEQEKERLLKLADLTINNEKDLADTKLRIQEDYQKKKDALDKENTVKEQALQDQRRQIIGSALTGITALVGAETKTGKGIAVAQATMDTYAGATKALAQGGIFGTVAAVGIIAQGLANVRNILNTDIPGQPDGGDNPPPPDIIENTVPVAPVFGAIGTEPPPVQAFVVESDVSSSQALQNDLNLQATL